MEDGVRNGGPRWRRHPALESRLKGVVLAIAKQFGLSPREIEIVMRSSTGVGTKEVAADLGCSAKTVDEHWRRILKKAGFASRWEIGAEVLARALHYSEPYGGEGTPTSRVTADCAACATESLDCASPPSPE
jgi:DNA-binding CsgD family transcriptional regulator